MRAEPPRNLRVNGDVEGSVNDYLRRADEAGMTWERARELDDGALEVSCSRPWGAASRPSAHRSIYSGCAGGCARRA